MSSQKPESSERTDTRPDEENGPSGVVQPPIPLLDLSRENGPLQAEIQAAIADVCQSGAFVLGPACQQLESSIAELSGTQYGIGCASGSDALLLALMALNVGRGDEVILPSFTFFATASAVTRLGARPVFVDIDPVTYNLDVDRVALQISSKTKAIIPVHLFGQSADMASLVQLAKRHDVAIVEDAAQAIGARHQNRPVGSWGDVGCYSFYPTKNLGGFGDGGMLVTSNQALAERLRLLRGHGMKPRYVHREVGINSRLDSIQAAVLNTKLKYLETWVNRRRSNAAHYHQLWAQTPSTVGELTRVTKLPAENSENFHVWNQFTIRVTNGLRDALRTYLGTQQIGSEIYYPIPLHLQSCFAELGYRKGALPHTEQAADEVLSLPVYPFLTETEQVTIVQQISAFFASDASRLNDYRAA